MVKDEDLSRRTQGCLEQVHFSILDPLQVKPSYGILDSYQPELTHGLGILLNIPKKHYQGQELVFKVK